MMESFF